MRTPGVRREGLLSCLVAFCMVLPSGALAQAPQSGEPSRPQEGGQPRSSPSGGEKDGPKQGSGPSDLSGDGKAPILSRGNWGSFKSDRCTGLGLRQKSSVLWDITGSWEQACYRTGATIDGHKFSHPARCVNTGLAMWGEFDVPDDTCMPHWGSFKKDHCTGVGTRQYSSVLWDIKDITWEDACWEMPALVQGVWFDRPSRCRTTAGGIWGEFDVPDNACGPISPE